MPVTAAVGADSSVEVPAIGEVLVVGGRTTFKSSERSLPMVPVTMAVTLLPVISLLPMVRVPFATFPWPLHRSKRCNGVLVN